jgi:hypothetical protein
MNQELNELQSFTVEQFQANFDSLMNRVENGECFIIKDGKRSAVIVPYKETIKYALDSLKTSVDDEIVRIYTDHEEGS